VPDQDTETAVTLTLNGVEVQAAKGELLINAAERNGVYIPRFCYHPRMTSVGMCRMCIVEVDTGRGPAIQPACMLPVAPDMKVDTNSPVTKKAQDGILEFLLINHPLDCPVCDKGGECPLQDHTVAFGPGESRFIEEKRHFEKPIPISPTVNLDRERCILCDRCTRFASEVAGDPLISFQGRGNHTEVNTFPDHPFASYFSGNTVQICPVGALTATPYRFKARPWDLDQVESTCQGCSVGCRIVIDASRDHILRYNGIDIDPVNWGWLCDKGRFGFEAVNHHDRLSAPLLRSDTGGELAEVRWAEALGAAAEAISEGMERSGPAGLAVLGGARLTNEDAYAWAKLAKGVLGTDNVDAQMGDGLPAELVLGLPRATIDETFAPGATVLVIGPDLKEELPVLFLRLRHAVRSDGVKVVELAEHASSITELAAVSLRHRPGAAAELARAVIGGGALPAGVGADDAATARDLLAAGPITVILGRPSLAESADGAVAVASYLLDTLDGVRFLSALRRANVHGALDMGLTPGLLPGRVSLESGRDWFVGTWPNVPEGAGLDATGILEAAADGRIDTLVLLGADPLTDFPDQALAKRALLGARTVIATDLFLTASAAQAHIVLPAAGFAECAGTTTNLEGRISTLGHKVTPPGTARTDWMIAAELALRLGADLGLESAEDIWAEIERLAPSHAGVTLALLTSPEGADGVVAPLDRGQPTGSTSIPPPADTAIPHGDPDRVEPDHGPLPEPEAGEAHVDAAAAATAAQGTDEPLEAQAQDAAAQDHTARATAVGDDHPAEPGSDDAATDGRTSDDPAPDEHPAADRTQSSAGRPPLIRFAPSGEPGSAPAVDAYSLRLVVDRKLYDRGTLAQHSPSMAALTQSSKLRVNPYDLDRLGVAGEGTVRVTSARTTLTMATVADPSVLRGTAALLFNQDGPSPSVLIDATAPVTDIRVETA